MNHKKDYFPRDLRALSSIDYKAKDGVVHTLFNPIQSFANLHWSLKSLEEELNDPRLDAEARAEIEQEHELVSKLLRECKEKIVNSFEPVRGVSPSSKIKDPIRVDHGVKAKVLKAIRDIESGKYDPSRESKPLKAVRCALRFSMKHGRMPTHGELLNLGFNDQQATDAGTWLRDYGAFGNLENAWSETMREVRKVSPRKK